MRNVHSGTGAFPKERLVAFKKSLLHLLQRVFRNLLVFLNINVSSLGLYLLYHYLNATLH